jgi:gluconolactonase
VKRFSSTALVSIVCIIALAARGWADEPAKTEKPRQTEKPATKTKKVEAKDITLNIPESWKQKPQGSQMRVAEFEVPPVGDDKEPGEYAVFFFGKGGAGGVDANIERWVGQLDAEGRKVKIFTGDSTLGKYTLVDLTGVYNKSIGPPVAGKKKRLPGWRVINVVIEAEAGPYFLKLDGPDKTIASVEKEFRASFGGKKDSEKEQDASKSKK